MNTFALVFISLIICCSLSSCGKEEAYDQTTHSPARYLDSLLITKSTTEGYHITTVNLGSGAIGQLTTTKVRFTGSPKIVLMKRGSGTVHAKETEKGFSVSLTDLPSESKAEFQWGVYGNQQWSWEFTHSSSYWHTAVIDVWGERIVEEFPENPTIPSGEILNPLHPRYYVNFPSWIRCQFLTNLISMEFEFYKPGSYTIKVFAEEIENENFIYVPYYEMSKIDSFSWLVISFRKTILGSNL